MPDVTTETENNDPSKALEKARQDTEVAVYDWLTSLGSQGAMDVSLKRTYPPEHQGVQTKGVLGHYDEPITEEQVKSAHGGGRFQVVVKTMRGNGQWKYAGSRTFEIAGEPKVDGLRNNAGSDQPALAPTNGADPLAGQAMSTMLKLTTEAQERAREATANSGTDWEAIERIVAPMREEVAALRASLEAKDRQVVELISKPPDTTGQDRLFGLMESKETTHGNALGAIRIQHDSEMRSIREFNRDEIKRRESRFEKELDSVREAATREIGSLKIAHTQALDSQRQGFEMRIDGLKDIQTRCDRELTAKETELIALRAKKEQGPLDQIQNLVTLKNGFDALVPAAAEPVSAWAKAAEVAGPLVEGIAARVMGAAAPPAQSQEPMLIEGEVADGEEEMVAVRRPDGKVIHLPRSTVERMQGQQAEKQADGSSQGSPADATPLGEEDVARAVSFIESAMRNGTDAETFARSARNMVPESILTYIKRRGIDVFLNDVAKIETGSPLATVAGRTYVRKVAKFLLEGTTEGIADEPNPAPVESS